MTLKISCIKLIREDIRHRGWAAALSCIALFLLMPVYALLYMSTFSDITPGSLNYQYLTDFFPGLLNGGSIQILAVGIAVLAILFALTGFGYIHSREKLDLYHSLPITRSRWFISGYLSGLLLFLVPYLICSGLTLAAGVSRGILSPELALRCAEAVVGGILAYLVIYSGCLLAVMLTGRTVIGLLASFVIIVLPFIMLTLFSALQSAFFRSYYTAGIPLAQKLADYLSPLGIFSELITQSSAGHLTFSLLASAVVMAALLTAISLFLYRIYPSEAAGRAIAFPVIAPVLKVIICIPASVFAGLILRTLMGITDNNLICLISLLASVVVCAFIEFIYTADLRLLLRNWRSTLVSVAGVLAILCIFRFDLTGYDTYLPAEDRLEGISFYPESFSGYFSYPDIDPPSEANLGYYVPDEEIGLVYALARSGIANLENGITADDFYNRQESQIPEDSLPVVFRYRLSGGRTVLRQYAVEREKISETLTQLMEDNEYRKDLFPVFHIDRDTVSAIELSDVYGQWEKLQLNKDQIDALLDAYEKDVMKISADTLINETPIGELTVDFPSSEGIGEPDVIDPRSTYSSAGYTMSVPMLYLYPEYENTLQLLEEYGHPVHTEINPADVASVSLSLSRETLEAGTYDDLISSLSASAERTDYEDISEITVTSEEDISLMLGTVHGYYSRILDLGYNYTNYLDIQYRDGNFYGYSF